MKIFFGIIIGFLLAIGVGIFFFSLQNANPLPQQQTKPVTQQKQEQPVFKGSMSILDAIDKYIEMNPRDSNAYLQKADYLAKHGKLKEALPLYDKALFYDGRNLQAYMNRGAVNYMLGNYEAAKRDLSVAINLDSSKGENFFNRGLANINTGAYAQAKSDFKEAANIFNKSADKKSLEQAKQGYEASSALLAQAKNNNGMPPTPKTGSKNTQTVTNKLQTSSNEALEQKYTSQLMSALSNTNSMLEKFKEARQKAGNEPGIIPDFEAYAASIREQTKKQFKQETAQKTFLDYMGEAQKKKASGDIEGALESINKAIELNPKEPELYYQRASLNMANKDPNAAIADYTKALSYNPKDANSLYGRAIARDMIGDKKGAKQDLQESSDLYKQQGDKTGLKRAQEMQNLWSGKEVSTPDKDFRDAANAFNQGNYKEALKGWENLLKKDPNNAAANYNMAITYAKLGNKESAGQYFEKTLQLNPNMAEAHDGYSRILLEQGKTQEALQHIDKSLQINPKNPNAYMTRGVIYLQNNDPSNAITDLSKAISYDNENPVLYYYLGLAQGMNNNPSAAFENMQKVKVLAKDNPELVAAAQQYIDSAKQ